MRSGGSKQKGSSFERKICISLSEWISNGKRKDLFWRSSMSGGRSTVALKQGTKLSSQAGDISAIDRLGNNFVDTFVTECKHYKDLKILSALVNGTGHFKDFWVKLKDEAFQHNKIPILIAKQNNVPTLICFTKKGMMRLPVIKKRFTIDHLGMHVLLFDDFLKIDPKKIRYR